jgi:very-short-patch-repair endonuclease/transposase
MEKLYKDKAWLTQKLVVEDVKITDIAKMFDVAYPTISYYARKFNIERPSNDKKASNMERSEKLKNKEWLFEQYIILNKSYDEICNEFGVGKTTVARWVKRHGLEKPGKPHERRKGEGPPVEVSCELCGTITKQKYAKVKNGYGRFCSQSCATKYAMKTTDLLTKLQEGSKKFFDTDEGREIKRRAGVKAALLLSDRRRTSIEIKMADELTNRGITYVEQHNLGDKFLLDFYLPEYKIVIECDGDYWHRLPKAIGRDKAKNAYVKACGLSMYRFWESEINLDVESCVDIVMKEINDLSEKASS